FRSDGGAYARPLGGSAYLNDDSVAGYSSFTRSAARAVPRLPWRERPIGAARGPVARGAAGVLCDGPALPVQGKTPHRRGDECDDARTHGRRSTQHGRYHCQTATTAPGRDTR